MNTIDSKEVAGSGLRFVSSRENPEVVGLSTADRPPSTRDEMIFNLFSQGCGKESLGAAFRITARQIYNIVKRMQCEEKNRDLHSWIADYSSNEEYELTETQRDECVKWLESKLLQD